ncbi:hypothetical protein HDU80_005453 [Chytriomyces hyalinus]|nr:hypothetical protein HDU80_005453 [Chytriomyces hyalinus]
MAEPMIPTKWKVLSLACCVLVGNFYAFDTPAALNVPLMKHMNASYDSWQIQLNLLYSAYSLPNTIIPFVSGKFIQSHGVERVLLGTSSVVLLGQMIFTAGISNKSFPTLLLGRVIFGIGGESVSVCQSCVVAQWFGSESQVSLALGLTLTISRFGSVLNSILSPRIERSSQSVLLAVWTATMMCVASFVCAIALVRVIRASSDTPTDLGPGDASNEVTPLLIGPRQELEIEEQSYVQTSIGPETPQGGAPTEFWLICLLCVLLYGTIMPFNNTASDFLMEKWYPNDTVTAGLVMSIPDSISTFLVPLSGFYMDVYGHRPLLLLACAVAVTFAHLALGLLDCSPIPGMITLGVAYSVYGAAIWGSIADIVASSGSQQSVEAESDAGEKADEGGLGRAYGISTSIYNTSLVFLPMVAAEIHVRSGGFLWVEVFFASLGLLGVFAAFALYVLDIRGSGVLDKGSRVGGRHQSRVRIAATEAYEE